MKVAAIVPAYNEESTIFGVVEALQRSPLISEVVVVSDGSADRTAYIALRAGASVVELHNNVGKGGAMKIGSENTNADILLFIDADLLGLKNEHISQLLSPVLDQSSEMSVGVFEDGRFATDFAQKIAPFLSGQRAVRRDLFELIPELEGSRYGVEMALSRYADKNNSKVSVVQLRDLSQIMKEEKQGLVKGFCARIKMYWEILRTVKL